MLKRRVFAAALCLFGFVSLPVLGVDLYELTAESIVRGEGVPKGRVERFDFEESGIYSGTRRAGWVYLPAQLKAGDRAALMVFQDGHAYVSETGQMRVPIVFDNLIAAGEMPVTVGVFINPGHRGEEGPAAEGWGTRSNRSVEYDTPDDTYVRFLLDELLPFVERTYDVAFSDDPSLRAICGMSSGGICAFTAAWERPGAFGRVLSHIGSFVNIRGGHVYPTQIRKAKAKPIRVFLQDGSNDLNNMFGDWPLANQQMARALAYSGYDHRFIFGDGAHNGKHGGVILPDSLRWLWRGWDPVGAAGTAFGSEYLISNTRGLPEWELVADGFAFLDAACVDGSGNVYVSDLPSGDLWVIRSGGTERSLFLANGPRISGMQFGPDGLLYALSQGNPGAKSVVVIDPESKAVEEVASGMNPNDLVVAPNGWIYLTDTDAGQVISVPITARGLSRPSPLAGGIDGPNGIGLSSDGRFLIVSEYRGKQVWRYELGGEGTLVSGERWATLSVEEGKSDSGGDGLELDDSGRIWVTSHAGIQVMSSEGSHLGTVPRPQAKATVSCGFGGPGRDLLYVCSSDKLYRLKTSVTRSSQ